MENIIELIEKIRLEKKATKADLCTSAGINKNMYSKYINGSRIPFYVVKSMFDSLDKRLIIIDKYNEVL